MGIITSRFRRKKGTKEQLESIEKDIKAIHEFRVHTEQRQKHFVGSLIAYSVVLYIIASCMFYFYYFPDKFSDQILYSLPLLLFPVLVWFLKEFIRWFFQCKLRKNETKLTDLLRRKRKILDEVMETETYLVARELLEKYDPDQLRKKTLASKDDVLAQVIEPELRQRGTGMSPPLKQTPAPKMSMGPLNHGQGALQGTFYQGSSVAGPMGKKAQLVIQGSRPPGPPMPRPILPRDRTFIDRLIEYLVGDGPNTRYALICRQCQSHNGMALREEFEYIAFRCCYCFSWNPARKQRPSAPRLPEQQFTPPPSFEHAGNQSKVQSDAQPSSSSTGESESAGNSEEEGDEDEMGKNVDVPDENPRREDVKEAAPGEPMLATVEDAPDTAGEESTVDEKDRVCP